MNRSRALRGSILPICVAVFAVLLILVLFGGQTIWSFLKRERFKQAVEAAALKAASDLSEIVINDPHFGFVSLSDRPAVGHATIAGDGEPVPVHGINTIIATCRLNCMIAHELGDRQLQTFAADDAEHAQEAAKKLDELLAKALRANCKDAKNMDGDEVHPYEDAQRIYADSLSNFTQEPAQDFELSLGWLQNSGATVTPVPYNRTSRFFSPNIEIKGCYKAYVDIPAGGQHFSFASLSSQPALVETREFMPADNKHICTIVKAKATCEIPDFLPWKKEVHTLSIQACGQPYAMDPKPPPTVLALSFPDGFPAGVNSMADLLMNQNLDESMMNAYKPVGNDYPTDRSCQLLSQDIRGPATWAFALALHDWLRSNYTVPKIDPVLAAINQSFSAVSNSSRPAFVFEFAANGDVVVSQLYQNAFPHLAVQEGQFYAVSDDPLPFGAGYWTVMCRDEVHALGTISGGKHAGQPLPGDPINWDELGTYVNEAFSHAAATRRPGGIALTGMLNPGGGIRFVTAQFEGKDGKTLSRDLRKSSYSSGLAAEVLISTARRPLR